MNFFCFIPPSLRAMLEWPIVSLHFETVNIGCNYDLPLFVLMASPNTTVCSTVFSYRHNRSIAHVQGNKTKISFNMAVVLVFPLFIVSWASSYK